MTLKEVQICFAAPEPRERIVAKFAILAGLRPGEILGLKWGYLSETHADIRQRLYCGRIDSPMTSRVSFRDGQDPGIPRHEAHTRHPHERD